MKEEILSWGFTIVGIPTLYVIETIFENGLYVYDKYLEYYYPEED